MTIISERLLFLDIANKAHTLLGSLNINAQIQNHSMGVNILSMSLADRISYLHPSEMIFLYWGSILHDIGKADINGSGQGVDYAQYSQHPVRGHQLAFALELPEDVLNIILFHHERYDGQGYPYGLSGKDIPFLARICSVANAVAKMTASSVQDSFARKTAFSELIRNRGTRFDPDIVDYFLDLKISKQ